MSVVMYLLITWLLNGFKNDGKEHIGISELVMKIMYFKGFRSQMRKSYYADS